MPQLEKAGREDPEAMHELRALLLRQAQVRASG